MVIGPLGGAIHPAPSAAIGGGPTEPLSVAGAAHPPGHPLAGTGHLPPARAAGDGLQSTPGPVPAPGGSGVGAYDYRTAAASHSGVPWHTHRYNEQAGTQDVIEQAGATPTAAPLPAASGT
eukprot:637683-Heterocapsa_arctica.AAC.1